MKLINKTLFFFIKFIHVFNNVNKTLILQHKFKNIKST